MVSHYDSKWPICTRGVVWLLLLACTMGASCTPRVGSIFGPTGPQAPVVLTPGASPAEVIAAVNANTARIVTYQADRASLTVPGAAGLPLLSAQVAVERPQRFRLRASTRLSGPEVDLGTNEDRFWLWARRNEPPGVYTARHAEFASSPARKQLPIEPAWLIDALGMPTLDPNLAYQGPFPGDSGRIELRAAIDPGQGGGTVAYVIDADHAWVLQQHRYDESGSLIASVQAERFRYDPVAQVSYPEKITLQAPAAQLSLSIDTGPVVLNAPIADNGQLWTLPQIAGVPVVDLGSPAANTGGTTAVWDITGAQANAPWPGHERISAPLVPSEQQADGFVSRSPELGGTAPTRNVEQYEPRFQSVETRVLDGAATSHQAPAGLPRQGVPLYGG